MFIKLDGTKLSQKLKEDLAKKVNNQKIKLLIIISDPSEASRIYVRNKINYCESLGIQTEVYDLSKIDNTNQFIVKMNQKISLSNPNGVLVQLPIKERLDTNKIIENIPIDLDVDAFLYHRLIKIKKKKLSLVCLMQC